MCQIWGFVSARGLDTCKILGGGWKGTIPSGSHRNVLYCGAGDNTYKTYENVVVIFSNVRDIVYALQLVYNSTTPPRGEALQYISQNTSLVICEASRVYSSPV